MIIKQITTGPAPSKGAIFDESSKKHEYKSLKKTIFLMPYWNFLVQIRCRFNAHFNFEVDPHIGNPQKLIFYIYPFRKQLKLCNRSTNSAALCAIQ